MIWYDSHTQRLRRVVPLWKGRFAESGQSATLPPHYAEELQKKIVGTVVLPGDPEYDRDRLLSNPRFSAFPEVIVYCEVEADVAECLHVARSVGSPVVVRSGGHSTGGFSSQNGFLIDVSRMNDVAVHPESLRAWAGPGTNFRKFNAKLQYFDLHTPGGACPDVCIGGYMQGGGYGFTARMFGMNCDQVEAVHVMLADGRIVDADAHTNSDLFWAIRGGTGSNFGVLLGVKYRLYQGSNFAGFSITWPMKTDEGAADAANALAWLQENFMRTGAPDKLGYQMIWAFEGPEDQPKEPMLLMRGMYRGPKDELETTLKAVLDLPGATLQALYDPRPYTDLNRVLLTQPYEVPQFPVDMTPMPPPEAKLSRYLAHPIAASDWLTLVRYFRTSPSPYTIVAMEIYGGGIAAVGDKANAFFHRDVYCDLFFDVFWITDAERQTMLEFLAGWEKLVAPHWNGRVYQNYPSPENPDFGENYWGNRYSALRAIKTKYDPGNLFRYPQSIALLDEPLDAAGMPGLSDPVTYRGSER